MPLITKIHKAVESGDLPQPFTVQDLKVWMKKHSIKKDDGENYAESSINAILSNSAKREAPTTNRNVKVLTSKINKDGVQEYSF